MFHITCVTTQNIFKKNAEVKCCGLNSVLHKIHVPPEIKNGILSGNKVFANVISYSHWHEIMLILIGLQIQ